jgi:excisionase family DNA binding protein
MRTEFEPLAYRINDACRVSGLGRTTIYEKLASGELLTKKVGGRRLVDAASLRALVSGQSDTTGGSKSASATPATSRPSAAPATASEYQRRLARQMRDDGDE